MSIGRHARVLVVAAVICCLAACSGAPSSGSTAGPDQPTPTAAATGLAIPTPAGSRPSSPAVIAITSPSQNAVITGASAHIVISLQNAQIVPATTTNISPDQGHVHLYVDNVLVSMNYGLEQDLPVHPGTYLLKAEFVAADHAPFSPRVWSPEVAFTVN
jgi:hypothetical protein